MSGFVLNQIDKFRLVTTRSCNPRLLFQHGCNKKAFGQLVKCFFVVEDSGIFPFSLRQFIAGLIGKSFVDDLVASECLTSQIHYYLVITVNQS